MQKISILAVVFFLVGEALHTLAQVNAIAQARNNPANSMAEVFAARWVNVLVRSAICLAFFILILQGQFVEILKTFRVPLPEIALAVLGLHVGSAVAFLAGFAFDAGLGYIPKLATSLGVPVAIDATPPPTTGGKS